MFLGNGGKSDASKPEACCTKWEGRGLSEQPGVTGALRTRPPGAGQLRLLNSTGVVVCTKRKESAVRRQR